MTEPRPLHVVVCDGDPIRRHWAESVAVEAGFDAVGRASGAPELLEVLRHSGATVAVVAEELVGMSGSQAVPHIRDLDPPVEVIVLAAVTLGLREPTVAAGAWDVVPRDDAAHYERVLAEVATFLQTGERRAEDRDRRTGDDRRQVQDWSKVTMERRQGDRREGLRREDDVVTSVKDQLEALRRDDGTPPA